MKKVKPPKSPLCVKVNGSSGVLESIDCSTEHHFICEVNAPMNDVIATPIIQLIFSHSTLAKNRFVRPLMPAKKM